MRARVFLAALGLACALSGPAMAATPFPSAVTAAFRARASWSFGASLINPVTCYQASAAYRCYSYHPVPGAHVSGSPPAVTLTVNGKPVKATIRAGIQLTHQSGCMYVVRSLGTSLAKPSGPVQTANACSTGWATRVDFLPY